MNTVSTSRLPYGTVSISSNLNLGSNLSDLAFLTSNTSSHRILSFMLHCRPFNLQ